MSDQEETYLQNADAADVVFGPSDYEFFLDDERHQLAKGDFGAALIARSERLAIISGLERSADHEELDQFYIDNKHIIGAVELDLIMASPPVMASIENDEIERSKNEGFVEDYLFEGDENSEFSQKIKTDPVTRYKALMTGYTELIGEPGSDVNKKEALAFMLQVKKWARTYTDHPAALYNLANRDQSVAEQAMIISRYQDLSELSQDKDFYSRREHKSLGRNKSLDYILSVREFEISASNVHSIMEAEQSLSDRREIIESVFNPVEAESLSDRYERNERILGFVSGLKSGHDNRIFGDERAGLPQTLANDLNYILHGGSRDFNVEMARATLMGDLDKRLTNKASSDAEKLKMSADPIHHLPVYRDAYVEMVNSGTASSQEVQFYREMMMAATGAVLKIDEPSARLNYMENHKADYEFAIEWEKSFVTGRSEYLTRRKEEMESIAKVSFGKSPAFDFRGLRPKEKTKAFQERFSAAASDMSIKDLQDHTEPFLARNMGEFDAIFKKNDNPLKKKIIDTGVFKNIDQAKNAPILLLPIDPGGIGGSSIHFSGGRHLDKRLKKFMNINPLRVERVLNMYNNNIEARRVIMSRPDFESNEQVRIVFDQIEMGRRLLADTLVERGSIKQYEADKNMVSLQSELGRSAPASLRRNPKQLCEFDQIKSLNPALDPANDIGSKSEFGEGKRALRVGKAVGDIMKRGAVANSATKRLGGLIDID